MTDTSYTFSREVQGPIIPWILTSFEQLISNIPLQIMIHVNQNTRITDMLRYVTKYHEEYIYLNDKPRSLSLD
jgi:hypothetical protein